MIVITYAYETEVAAFKQLVKNSLFDGKLTFHNFRKSPLILENSRDLILNMGFAGALDQNLALGQVVLIKQVIDAQTNQKVIIDSTAHQLAAEFATNESLPKVRLLTSKEPVTDSVLRDELRQKTGADIVDMEGFSLFEIARQGGIPIVSFKVISDNADNDAWQMVKQNTDKWSEALGQTVFEFIKYYESKRNNTGVQPDAVS